jgi:protocatechuate 3,4-dioxygenase beta subunit
MTMRPFSRRLLLATTVLPLHRALAADLAVTPAQTEGPFYPVAVPADFDNDLVQVRGQAAHAMGTILHLQGRVLDASGKPMIAAMVEIWQCDAQGLYDHPGQPGRERRDSAFQGYGRFVSDEQSHYGFRTLKPVAYPGRTPHIHLKVAAADGRRLTTQFYLAGDPQNERDFVYRAAVRDPRARERIEMRPEPAPGIEPGALSASMDIVIA